MRLKSACARCQILKPGKSPCKFTGRAERKAPKPACISPQIDRQSVTIDDCRVPVAEEIAFSTPFASLLHFQKKTGNWDRRFSSLPQCPGIFRPCCAQRFKTMLPAHDIYITDWHNARDIPLAEGHFGFSSFVDHVIQFLRFMGPGSHVVAVCQPCVPVLAAVALVAQDRDESQPRARP
jgi:poly(3-hydroxybutyrate) depolymerase